jgi:uncharacterized membrane protein YkoI
MIMLCAAASIGGVMAAAAEEKEKDEQENTADIGSAVTAGEIMSLQEIIKRATDRYPGKVTEIELGSSDGRYQYEVDVTDAGGVKRELILDAKTAELLSSEVDEDDEKSASTDKDDEEAAADEGDDEDDLVATETSDVENTDSRK